MEAILNKLYFVTKEKVYYNDLDLSLKIEKVLKKIKYKL